jgi:hypothetical protein
VLGAVKEAQSKILGANEDGANDVSHTEEPS